MKSHFKSLIFLCVIAVCAAQNRCPSPDGYFPDSAQCDGYYECKEGVSSDLLLCPEGLLFNERVTGTTNYPCGYPQEVECGRRTKRQPANPSGTCPHQYALLKSSSCSTFLTCVGGAPTEHNCPEGLAFNEQNLQCDWPDQVEGCQRELSRGFACPAARNENGIEDPHPRHPDPADCRKFFVCIDGVNPRQHSCEIGKVFDDYNGACVDATSQEGGSAQGGRCASYYPREVLDALEVLRRFEEQKRG